MKKINIKIKDREIECIFGLQFLGELLESTGLTIEQTVERMIKNPFKMLPQMIFQSANSAQERLGKELDFTIYELTDDIEDSGGINQPEVLRFIEAFKKSLMKGVPDEEPTIKKDDSKKK